MPRSIPGAMTARRWRMCWTASRATSCSRFRRTSCSTPRSASPAFPACRGLSCSCAAIVSTVSSPPWSSCRATAWTPAARQEIHQILAQALDGRTSAADEAVDEGPLVRLHYNHWPQPGAPSRFRRGGAGAPDRRGDGDLGRWLPQGADGRAWRRRRPGAGGAGPGAILPRLSQQLQPRRSGARFRNPDRPGGGTAEGARPRLAQAQRRSQCHPPQALCRGRGPALVADLAHVRELRPHRHRRGRLPGLVQPAAELASGRHGARLPDDARRRRRPGAHPPAAGGSAARRAARRRRE